MKMSNGIALSIIVLVAIGCGKKEESYSEFDTNLGVAETTLGEHDHEAPHGGELIELGEHEYHAEVVMDEDHHKLTVYLYGHETDETLAIEQDELTLKVTDDGKEKVYKLIAQKADAADSKSSEFSIESEELIDLLHDHDDVTAELHVTIDGKDLHAAVEHHHEHGDGEKHGDHGEKHGDHGEKHGDHDDKHDVEHKDKDGEHAGEKDNDKSHKDDKDNAGK